jgi:hypothetical protein
MALRHWHSGEVNSRAEPPTSELTYTLVRRW